jgi:hypothetical protein
VVVAVLLAVVVSVVVGAEQDAVVDGGGSAVGPVRRVVDVAPGGGVSQCVWWQWRSLAMMARRWAAVKVRVARPESRIWPSGPVMILEMEPSQASILAASALITVPNPSVAPPAP